LLAIRQLSWWSRKELHWYAHGSFISNVLGVSFVCSWSFTALQDTVGSPPLVDDVGWYEDACHGISLSWSLLPTCKLVFSNMMEIGIFLANKRWVASCFSSAP
jgi:hypothetical protein